jgi:hypothetical protein
MKEVNEFECILFESIKIIYWIIFRLQVVRIQKRINSKIVSL